MFFLRVSLLSLPVSRSVIFCKIPSWIKIEGITPAALLKDRDIVGIGEINWRVIHTPGHSPGSICFYCPDEELLISGDTLFKGTIGNLELPTGEPERMWPSLQKLSLLPPTVHVFPGHGGPTTIGAESWLKTAKEKFGG